MNSIIIMIVVTVVLFVLIMALLLSYIIIHALKSPFIFPYFIRTIDVSGKRKPQIDSFIDKYLIFEGFDAILDHKEKIESWKQESEQRVERSLLKKYRQRQYLYAVDENAYVFHLVRSQKRYTQSNYVKSSYNAAVKVSSCSYSFEQLQDRYNRLAKIGFKCTLDDYYRKNQRKLVTPELRNKIKRRDNYTCQLCGKYMPDEVGLEIDHIVPISRGGKSTPSNLRVLCSRCNRKKSAKMDSDKWTQNMQDDDFWIHLNNRIADFEHTYLD